MMVNILGQQEAKYLEARSRIDNEYNTPITQLENIEEIMEVEPIKAIKFNYTVDYKQNQLTQYSSVISISDNADKIIITTIRPNSKFNKPEYILEADKD